jgi:hypothetical protein
MGNEHIISMDIQWHKIPRSPKNTLDESSKSIHELDVIKYYKFYQRTHEHVCQLLGKEALIRLCQFILLVVFISLIKVF